MKRSISVFAGIFFTAILVAQAPDAFIYQAVIRDNSGSLIVEQKVGIQIDILKAAPNGISVYSERHTQTTNTYGLVNLSIGSGTTSGDFSAIKWDDNKYFIQISLDITGGTLYDIMGATQLLSVPYALHAKTANKITGKIKECDPEFHSSVASAITQADTSKWNASAGSNSKINALFYPDGFKGFQPVYLEMDSLETYTVPEGKNFYVTKQSAHQVLNIDTDSISYFSLPGLPIDGTVTCAGNSTNNILNGFLVDARVKPTIKDITLTLEYTVPECFAFILSGVSAWANDMVNIHINGKYAGSGGFSTPPGWLILKSGDIISLEGPSMLTIEKAWTMGYIIP